jgi:hypothetical protein
MIPTFLNLPCCRNSLFGKLLALFWPEHTDCFFGSADPGLLLCWELAVQILFRHCVGLQLSQPQLQLDDEKKEQFCTYALRTQFFGGSRWAFIFLGVLASLVFFLFAFFVIGRVRFGVGRRVRICRGLARSGPSMARGSFDRCVTKDFPAPRRLFLRGLSSLRHSSFRALGKRQSAVVFSRLF